MYFILVLLTRKCTFKRHYLQLYECLLANESNSESVCFFFAIRPIILHWLCLLTDTTGLCLFYTEKREKIIFFILVKTQEERTHFYYV